MNRFETIHTALEDFKTKHVFCQIRTTLFIPLTISSSTFSKQKKTLEKEFRAFMETIAHKFPLVENANLTFLS